MIYTCGVGSRKASNVFSKEDFSAIGWFCMNYMKLFVGKVIDSKTRESCIPTYLVKSGDDCLILVHSTGIGAYINSNKTNFIYLRGIVANTYIQPREPTRHLNPFRGNQEGFSPEPCKGNSATLLCYTWCLV